MSKNGSFFILFFLPPTRLSSSDSCKPKDKKLWPKLASLQAILWLHSSNTVLRLEEKKNYTDFFVQGILIGHFFTFITCTCDILSLSKGIPSIIFGAVH